MSDLCTKTEMLKLWRLVTFEPLKVEQSYIPLLKALMYGISASGAQGCDNTLSICHALLKNALLLSEIAKRPTFIFGNCTYIFSIFKLIFLLFLGGWRSHDWQSWVWTLASRQGHQCDHLRRNGVCRLLWWGQRQLSRGLRGPPHDRNWGALDPHWNCIGRIFLCKTGSTWYLSSGRPNLRLDILFNQQLNQHTKSYTLW